MAISTLFDMVSRLDSVSNVVVWAGLRIESVAATVWVWMMQSTESGMNPIACFRWKLQLSKEKPTLCSVIRTHVMRMLFRIRFDGLSTAVMRVSTYRFVSGSVLWMHMDSTVFIPGTPEPVSEFLDHFYYFISLDIYGITFSGIFFRHGMRGRSDITVDHRLGIIYERNWTSSFNLYDKSDQNNDWAFTELLWRWKVYFSIFRSQWMNMSNPLFDVKGWHPTHNPTHTWNTWCWS